MEIIVRRHHRGAVSGPAADIRKSTRRALTWATYLSLLHTSLYPKATPSPVKSHLWDLGTLTDTSFEKTNPRKRYAQLGGRKF